LDYKIVRSLHDTPVGVIADSASSNLFFTTSSGLFLMKPNGGLKTLHMFRGGHKDGSLPGVPMEGSDGMLYGTTQGGGLHGLGTIYKINKNGSGYRVLYHYAGAFHFNLYLTEGSDGALYGTTVNYFGQGTGTAFKVGKDGTGFLVLHDFATDAGQPHPGGRLIEDSDGLLYGTADNTTPSIAYAMNKDGSGFNIIHSFGASGLITGLTEGNDGALYGMVSSQSGAVFRLTKTGDGFSILANAGASDTEAGLVKLPDGSFCGTTAIGGNMDLGQVFKVLPTANVVIFPPEGSAMK
jgi:uncharacterized repeat protein (TIGR03803 family)